MNEKEKNPRLRHSKYLSSEAQVKRRRALEILEASGPQSKLGVYIPLTEAAEQLGCTQDALLDMGASGKLDIYAPVLDEGMYVWPVTESGLPHSRVMGVADPAFKARFSLGDYMILPSQDVKRIGLGASLILRGFIDPVLTSQLIEDWEAERQKEREAQLAFGPPLAKSFASVWREDGASERMKALVRQVPWIPLVRATNPEGGEPPARDDVMVRADMLRVDRRDIIAKKPGAASLQHKTGRPGKRSGLHQEIIQAQAEARQNGLDANNPKVIWGILARMSEEPESKSSRLRGYDRDGIQYIAGDGKKTYTYSALQKYLRPRPKSPDIPE